MLSQLSIAAVLIALAVALGFLLAGLPNIEGVSTVSFVSGYLVGPGWGASVGATSILLLSVLNPLGPAPPPVLAAQLVGMITIGCAGHLWRKLASRCSRPELLAICIGVIVTIVYDILTNYGVAVAMGRWSDPLPVIVTGVPFSVVHVVSNAMIFGGVAVFVRHKHRNGA